MIDLHPANERPIHSPLGVEMSAPLLDVIADLLGSAYLFRAVDDDFVLVGLNRAAVAANPMMERFVGQRVARLYESQPQVIEDAHTCIRERRTVTRETKIRRFDRLEATTTLRLVYAFHAPDLVLLHSLEQPDGDAVLAMLREAETRYETLVASLPEGVLLRDLDGRIVAASAQAARMMGREGAADLIGRHIAISPPYRILDESGHDVEVPDWPYQRAVRERTLQPPVVYEIDDASGTRYLRIAASPIPGQDGTIVGSVTVFGDVTDVILARRAAAETAARLELSLEAARMATWEFTPAAGLTFSAHPGSPFARPVLPEDAGPLIEGLGAALAAGDGQPFERVVRFGDSDAPAWGAMYGRARADPRGPRISGAVRDVTEQRRLEEELAQAQRLESIGRLAGGLAHDFNNLLAAMLGGVELIEERLGQDPEARDELTTVRHAAERARDLTGQLLAFARRQPVALVPLDLGGLVERADRLLRRLVGPTATLRTTLGADAWVRADAAQLEQVLVNLVVNARDASPNGVIAIAVAVDEDAVTLSVADQGAGMDAATAARVFDPFFTTKARGTGLGLASAYGVVRQHGGTIAVETAPGAGSRFQVRLPRVPAPPSAAPARAKPTAPEGRGTLLVVDDEELVRDITRRTLQTLGYTVLAADGGAQALAVAAAFPGPFVAVVCDVAMPGQAGPEVVAALRRTRPDLPALFVSGYAAEGPTIEAIPNAAFLAKPYTRRDLEAKLRVLTGAG